MKSLNKDKTKTQSRFIYPSSYKVTCLVFKD